MPNANLPERPSLEYLRKLAKDRLDELRRTEPAAQLSAALLSVARDYGFPSWRALKAEVERRRSEIVTRFFDACASGDVDAVRTLLAAEPGLARAARTPASGWTGLHEAAKRGHERIAALLLEQGADPNAREAGDNTSPLHWAAASAHIGIVRALLDAGGDVHGLGDVHELDVIGWAAFFRPPGETSFELSQSKLEVISLLVERGAQHHIFSAMSVGDLALVRAVVEENPEALDRRLSRFERRLTPLHVALERQRHDILDLLVELGADLEAKDGGGRTALEAAMLSGDREGMRRLRSAGAQEPQAVVSVDFIAGMTAAASATTKSVTMIYVLDISRALEWYTSIGFKEIARFADDGVVNFGMVSFGKAELMLNLKPSTGSGQMAPPHDASIWFYTDRVDTLYQLLKARQFETGSIVFRQDIEDMFYGARQFCILDPNGYELYFIQSLAA